MERLLAEKGVEAGVEAVVYFPVRRPEYVVLVSRLRQGVKVLREPGLHVYLVDKSDFVDDVYNSSYAEVFAHRLLLPHTVVKGEELMQILEKTYRRETVRQLLKDLVAAHKYAAVNLVVEPRYFLLEKVRRIVETFPLLRSDFSNILLDERGFEDAASELVSEGLLNRVDGGYSPTLEAVKKFEKLSVLSGLEPLRRINLIKLSKLFSLLVFEAASNLSSQSPTLPDPEQHIHLRTSRGLQPLSKQLDIMEFVREYFGEEGHVKRVGGLFNSTYVIEVGSEKLFAKRYMSWTDVKWVAARIWTAWIKDFSINPSTRLAKEIYFLDFLRGHGFYTPEIIHVNWRDKILYTTYVEGETLLDAWLEKNPERDVFAEEVGHVLASVHRVGGRLGDCKPESFIKTSDGKIFITDVEQASFDGDPAWDLMELIFYPGHYLEADEAASLAEHVVKGYANVGDTGVIARCLKTSYVRTMSLWTPPWVVKEISDRVKRFLKA